MYLYMHSCLCADCVFICMCALYTYIYIYIYTVYVHIHRDILEVVLPGSLYLQHVHVLYINHVCCILKQKYQVSVQDLIIGAGQGSVTLTRWFTIVSLGSLAQGLWLLIFTLAL